MPGKGKGYRTEIVDGFEILVGKGDAGNDDLTFRIAEPGDLWFHVAGYSGSHVILRLPEGSDDPPRKVVEQAARLAAWHSKARGSGGKVEVHYCRASDVRKPRGYRAGKVQLARWNSIKVYARES
jgi:predicted ribosome quality control (RQC) complex YloA/Tae2 family protein